MKKRWIVSAAALSAAALAVTGCGASASDSSASGNSGDSAASGDAGELYVYNWGEYIDETVIDEFEEETGIKVVYDLFETNEEMYPVIEAGGIAYDAVCPSDFMIQKMREHDLLAEINFDNVPNIDQIDPLYMELSKSFDPENKYAVPYTWGTIGILYNKERLQELGVPAPTKWADLFKNRKIHTKKQQDLWDERLSGEILMQDSIRSAFMTGLKKNGYSLNSTNPDEINKAKQDLIDQKPLVQAYVVDQVRDKMIGGEAAVGIIYSGDALHSGRGRHRQPGICDPRRGHRPVHRLLGHPEKCEKQREC